MKRLLLFLAVLVGFSGVSSAQIGYNDVQFYVEAGESLDSNAYVYIIISVNGEIVINAQWSSQIKESVKADAQYLYSPQKILSSSGGWSWGSLPSSKRFKKNYDLSTSSKVVYTISTTRALSSGWNPPTESVVYHLAFSNDGKTMTKWTEGRSEYRTTYIRVDKDEFKPKADNLDFLYE
ncbi:MAG: hypothetical protein IJ314_02060 [Bacteroidales bacterium]|nr:hypothetical protein [Bacteroidales bacterium]